MIDVTDSRGAQYSEREAQRMQANREELVERIARAITEDGTVQPIKGVSLSRRSAPLQQLHSVTEPSLAVIAQGSKEVLLGDSRYQYDSSHYLLTTVGMPTTVRVFNASKEKPYLSLRLELPPALVGSVIVEAGSSSPLSPAAPGGSGQRRADVRAMDVSPLDANLLDAVVRLVRLLDSPDEASILMPLITREIVYRLLMGEQSARLRLFAVTEGYTPDIVRAVERLRQDFDKPLRVEELAREVGLSVSGFHHHFKSVTAMSPLQFQKHLRMQEARRLMLGEDLEAASAASRVGYYDASHFNREYKSFFGDPPVRDIQRLRQEALVSAASPAS